MINAIETPNYDEFAKVAKKAGIVGICVPMHFDHETVVALADRFVDKSHFFLLESAAVGSAATFARYSYLGFDTLWEWSEAEGREVLRREDGQSIEEARHGDAMAALRRLVTAEPVQVIFPADTPSHIKAGYAAGGAVGYFAYDVAAEVEPSIGPVPPRAIGMPASHFFMPKNLLVVDQLTSRLYVTRFVHVSSNGDAASAFRKETTALHGLVRSLRGLHSPAPLVVRHRPIDFDAFEASIQKDVFLEHAARMQEEIRAGEIFQIQIGNRLTKEVTARPFDVFRHLRSLNPSPYMFFYKFGKHHVLGASPEMMVGVQGRQMVHRPIAGTRKRTWDPIKDEAMQKELVHSEKERAEHVMLVDLSRNDIGRIATPGSVHVDELMVVEKYSHVFHMVSQVRGELRDGEDAFSAMRVSFPNGTVSGAPKIRAIQLIYEVEPVAREFYAGSLAMFDHLGELKSTILIRTIHMADGRASTQASAGIVYDSIPEQEWLETRNKMMACLTAIQNTE